MVSMTAKYTFYDETSIDRPSIAAPVQDPIDRVFVAWRGNENSRNISVGRILFDVLNGDESADRASINNCTLVKSVTEESSESAPSLALSVDNAHLFMSWTGINNNYINIGEVVYDDAGQAYVPRDKWYESDNTSSVGPTIACFANRVYVAWTGDDAERSINIGEYDPSSGAFRQVKTAERSYYSPALAADANIGPCLSWFATDGRLYVANVDATSLNITSKRDYDERSDGPPASAWTTPSHLVIGWAGVDGRSLINTSEENWMFDIFFGVDIKTYWADAKRTFDESGRNGFAMAFVNEPENTPLKILYCWTGIGDDNYINVGLWRL